MMKKAIHYITHWEDWHWFAKYALILPAWLWLCLKARSFWFFMPANPTLTFGGFIGEPKREMYKQLPPSSYPKSIYISPTISFQELQAQISVNQFTYPLIVKPDKGMMGLMFRKIESFDQLRQYHLAMPVDYIVQEMVSYPIEVSVFYYRYPGETKGHITGFLRKDYLQVVGDGKSTLRELILKCSRAQFRIKEMFSKHQSKLDTIVPAGEAFHLSEALNLSRGGRLISLEHEKDERLLKVFDDLSHYSKHFYYGRYDIKCASIEDLKQGKNYSILEFNGCGAEPHHIYHNGYSLAKACRILVEHWNVLYKISDYNYRQGIPRWSYLEGLRFTRKSNEHFKKLKALDSSFEFKPEGSLRIVNNFSKSTTPGLRVASTR
jgi:hypothetical protein